jgi:hypothetical protein
MKDEKDLPVSPNEPPAAEDTTHLFTDSGDGGGESMLPGYDGAEGSPTAVPEPYEAKGEKLLRLKLPGGHAYTAKTERELLELVYKGKVAADEAIRDREAQIRNLQQAGPAGARPNPSPGMVQAPPMTPGEEWDPQKYLNLLGEDPMKARLYQDKFMYGGLDPVQATSYAYNVAQKLDQQMLAASFHDRNPDFPISPENSQKLMGVLQARGLAPNIVNLEWAYGEMKRNGVLAPAGPGAAVDENQYEEIDFGAPGTNHAPPVAPRPAAPAPPQPPAGPQRRGGGAPPSPRNGGGNNTPDVVSFEQMTLAELKAHAQKIGALRH